MITLGGTPSSFFSLYKTACATGTKPMGVSSSSRVMVFMCPRISGAISPSRVRYFCGKPNTTLLYLFVPTASSTVASASSTADNRPSHEFSVTGLLVTARTRGLPPASISQSAAATYSSSSTSDERTSFSGALLGRIFSINVGNCMYL